MVDKIGGFPVKLDETVPSAVPTGQVIPGDSTDAAKSDMTLWDSLPSSTAGVIETGMDFCCVMYTC